MEKQALSAEVRKERGKGPARQLRMQGKIPAVLYGPGGDTVALSVDPIPLTKALTGPYRRNQLLELQFSGGQSEHALVKDVEVHPVGRQLRHVDFYRVDLARPVTTNVPLRTKGRAKGVAKGGELRQHFREVPVRALPDSIPAEVMINVENVDMLESVRVKDVVLPDGLEILLPPERALVFVTAEQKKIVEETDGAPGADKEKAAAAAKAPATASPSKPPPAKAPAKAPAKK